MLVGFALVRVLLLSAKHLFLATALRRLRGDHSYGEVSMMARRLSTAGRAELEARREKLQLELG